MLKELQKHESASGVATRSESIISGQAEYNETSNSECREASDSESAHREAASSESTDCENESDQARLERLGDKYVKVLSGAVDILIEQDNEALKHSP